MNVTGGPLIMTFTPLLGMSEVVRRFLLEKSPQRHVTKMTLDDAEHYTDKQRADIIAQYPEHMRDIRAKGIPSFGAGLIFPIDEKSILVEPFTRPSHWVRLGGLDLGGRISLELVSSGTIATLTLCTWSRPGRYVSKHHSTTARCSEAGA